MDRYRGEKRRLEGFLLIAGGVGGLGEGLGDWEGKCYLTYATGENNGHSYIYSQLRWGMTIVHRARIPSPLPSRVAKTGRNHLNEEFTPLLPTGIGERF